MTQHLAQRVGRVGDAHLLLLRLERLPPRRGDALRQLQEQVAILGVELLLLYRIGGIEHAQQAALMLDRHRQEGAALVELAAAARDFRVFLGARHADRAAVDGDPTGDAAARFDAHAAHDVFIDAHGGANHQRTVGPGAQQRNDARTHHLGDHLDRETQDVGGRCFRLGTRLHHDALLGAARQAHGEVRALIWLAVGVNASAVVLDDRLADREPQAGSAIAAHQRGVHLVEAFEDALERLPGNTDPGVDHIEPDFGAFSGQHKSHRSSRWRELDRIVAKMERQLAHLVPAGIHAGIGLGAFQLEGHPTHLGDGLEQLQRFPHDFAHVDRLPGAVDGPRVEAVEVQQRLDQAGQPLGLLIDDGEEVLRLLVRDLAVASTQHGVDKRPDRGDGGTQLVRNGREEVGFELVHLLVQPLGFRQLARLTLGLAIEPGILDGHHRVVPVDLEQLDDFTRGDQPVFRIVHREVRHEFLVAVEQRHEQDVVGVPLPLLARSQLRLHTLGQRAVERVRVADEVRMADPEFIAQPRQELVHRDLAILELRPRRVVHASDGARAQPRRTRFAHANQHHAEAEAVANRSRNTLEQGVEVELGVDAADVL